MLKRVSIQNFKSLKDVTLDLQKVNLLIGPNNSGKTNFLKALEFCQKHQPLTTALMFNQQVSNNVKIHLSFDYFKPSLSQVYDNLVFKVFNNEDNEVLEEDSYSYTTESLSTQEEMISDYYESNLFGYSGNIKLYRPNPTLFIQPAEFSADAIELAGDCSNLISFLFYINTNYKRAYKQIETDLSNCVNDIVSFSTPPIKVGKQSKLGLKLFGRKDEDYWADDVSEGVLYFLALLTIINQPNPPKLLLLEEPEKGIHPRRIREVMDFIFRLAEEKDIQIILTTHNEHVLDDFATRPESVFVFDKDEDGATYVRNLQTDIIEPTNKRNSEMGLDPIDLTTNLSENWLYGLLGGVPSIV